MSVCDEFVDDFEADRGWSKFEELVGEEKLTVHCYAKDIGTASRSAAAKRTGEAGFLVHANAERSHANNHVIGQLRLDNRSHKGQWSYEVAARIDADPDHLGEVGPELSLQNTESVSSGCTSHYQTVTGGLQYLVKEGRFNFWTTADSRGTWATSSQPVTLARGRWYIIRMVIDLDARSYVSVDIEADGKVTELADAAGKSLGIDRNKFTEEAFWATLESQNLWNNCDKAKGYDDSLAITEFSVSYDDLAIRRVKTPTPGREPTSMPTSTSTTCTTPCPSGWQRGNLQGQPDPNGVYCIFRRADPGGDIALGASSAGGAVLARNAPSECAAGGGCGVRVMIGAISECPSNDSGTLVFRCDGDPGTDVELLAAPLRDDPDPAGGPSFNCRTKLDIFGGQFTSNCRVHVNEFRWTGQKLGSCP